MSKSLFGAKIAILVANGFNENDLTALQRLLLQTGASTRIISPESGLVNSWNGEGWGHHYAIDTPLGSALGADYSMLVIPGGSRSMDKLKLTAHTKRFIGSFMAASKAVAVCSDATAIMDALGFVGDNVICDNGAKVVDFFATHATIAQEADKAA